ncbi:hypothetical protein ABZW11_38320 [Nonomuraea sp. NPDC004580]|uniref:hypothetical protein n=1 Tax=Nonomuraea sp. NPDC004580 TaxID=3154552 RepID=UPI0033B744B1
MRRRGGRVAGAGAPLPTAGNPWNRIGQQRQDVFDPNLVSANPIAEQAKDAVESVAGPGEIVIDYSPARAAIGPDFELQRMP